MKNFINKYFSLLLSGSCILGFFMPNLGSIGTYLIPTMLALVIFSSFFQTEFTKEVLLPNTKKVLIYYVLRYVLVPVALFFAIKPFSDFYSAALLLLFLLPAAVSSPAFTGIFKGNVNLAIGTVVVSNTLTPFVIPFFCSILMHSSRQIDQTKMFITLFFTVVFPLIVHFPFRRNQKIKQFMIDYNALIAVVGISCLFLIAISKFKADIIKNLPLMPLYLSMAFAIYIALYIIGWYILPKYNRQDKLSNTFCSGANNIGLGVTLTILYFSPEINIFFIVSQMSWAFILVPIKWWFARAELKAKV